MNQTTHKNYVLPIAMMFLLFFIISFVTGLQNPMGVIVKDQFNLNNYQSQLGNMANFLAYFFMGIPSGKLLRRIGYKKTALFALIMGFTGVLVMYLGGKAASFWIYLAGAFISGFTMCTLNTVVNPMLTVLGSKERANQRLNFGGACNSFGATIVPILGGVLMGNAAQKTISDADPLLFVAMGIFALVFVVLVFVQIPEPHIESKEQLKIKDKYSALSFRHFRLGVIAIFIYVGTEVGIGSIANLYLTNSVEHGGLGIDPSLAGSIVGIYYLLMLVGRLLGGVLGGIVSSRQMLASVSGLGLLFVLIGIYAPDYMVKMPVVTSNLHFELADVHVGVAFLMLCGICISVMWPCTFNLATEGLGKYIAEGSGFFMTMVVGGGVLPMVQGAIADSFGYLDSYWLIVACMGYLLYYALIGSHNVNDNIPVE